MLGRNNIDMIHCAQALAVGTEASPLTLAWCQPSQSAPVKGSPQTPLPPSFPYHLSPAETNFSFLRAPTRAR